MTRCANCNEPRRAGHRKADASCILPKNGQKTFFRAAEPIVPVSSSPSAPAPKGVA